MRLLRFEAHVRTRRVTLTAIACLYSLCLEVNGPAARAEGPVQQSPWSGIVSGFEAGSIFSLQNENEAWDHWTWTGVGTPGSVEPIWSPRPVSSVFKSWSEPDVAAGSRLRIVTEAVRRSDTRILPVTADGRTADDWGDRCDGLVPPAGTIDAGRELRGFLPMVWRDARGIVRTRNMVILSAALAAAIGIRQDLDDEVREEVAAHPLRWGEASEFLGHLGEAPYQVPILAAVWGVAVWTDNHELNSVSKSLLSAYTINGLAVLLIKGIADTDRPDPDWNGGRWGFPSFHAASSFSIAGVLEEYYGWGVGLPAYALAGVISWSRIDERDHDLSDVVFGAVMGWVIGKSVAGQHLRDDGRVRIVPWRHPESGAGLMMDWRY